MTNINHNLNLAQKAFLSAIAALCFSCAAFALPGTGPTNLQTSSGVSFETAGSKLTFTAPDKSVLNWNAFGSGTNAISAGDAVVYNLPNTNASVLNVVSGGASTTIEGALASNGKLYILNPNGIIISGSSRIDTNGFTLSTVDNAFSGQFHYLNNGKLASETGARTASGNTVINGNAIINSENITILTKDIAVNGGFMNGSLIVSADGLVSLGLAGNTFYISNGVSVVNPTGNTIVGAPNAVLASNGAVSVNTTSGTIINAAGSTLSAGSVSFSSVTGDINVSGISAVKTSIVGKNVTIGFGNAAKSSLSANVTGNLIVTAQNFLTLDSLNNSSGTTSVTSSGKLTLGDIHIDSIAPTSFVGSSVVDSFDNSFVYGPVLFASTVGEVAITKAGHSFGPVSVNSATSATVYEGAALNLNIVRAKDLTVKTGEFFFQTPVTASLIADKFNLAALGTVNFITGNIAGGLTVSTFGNIDLSKLSLLTNLNGVTPSVTTRGTVTNPAP